MKNLNAMCLISIVVILVGCDMKAMEWVNPEEHGVPAPVPVNPPACDMMNSGNDGSDTSLPIWKEIPLDSNTFNCDIDCKSDSNDSKKKAVLNPNCDGVHYTICRCTLQINATGNAVIAALKVEDWVSLANVFSDSDHQYHDRIYIWYNDSDNVHSYNIEESAMLINQISRHLEYQFPQSISVKDSKIYFDIARYCWGNIAVSNQLNGWWKISNLSMK